MLYATGWQRRNARVSNGLRRCRGYGSWHQRHVAGPHMLCDSWVVIHAWSLCSMRDARQKQANAQASFLEVVRQMLLCRGLLETQCCCSSLVTGALPVQQLPIYTRHTLDTFSRSLSTHPPEQTVRVIMLKPGNILRVLCLPQATASVLAASSPKSTRQRM